MTAEESSALDLILNEAPEALRGQVNDALAAYANPSRGPQDDFTKATKLRGAFTSIQDWLLGQVLPNLNEAQWLFLCTGSLGDRAMAVKGGAPLEVQLLPDGLHEALEKARAEKTSRPPWGAVILDFEDRVMAIARGELVGMDQTGKRRGKPQKVLGGDHLKVKVQNRLDNLVFKVKELLNQLDNTLGGFLALREEQVIKGVKLNVEALKKFTALAANSAPRSEQEAKFLASVGDKVASIAQSIGGIGSQLESVGSALCSTTVELGSKFGDLKATMEERDKLAAGGEAGLKGMFDPDTITFIRRDADTLAEFMVRASEAAENKVPFSTSRILVKEQWSGFEGARGEDCIATVPGVVKAIEKIGSIHINVFPKDMDGHYIIPPILIEPVRNYIEWFDDRLAISLVSGEAPKKGPKVSFTPLEMEVLRTCGVYLSKDPLYDYRGELNAGTFIGDYSGKVEKRTTVKWAGENKKFSMASTSEVVDGASRAEAVQDYIDCVFAFANGIQPPMKLSKRKIAVILRYCLIESIERTVALTLMNVAQHEPNEAKETILKHVRKEDEARAMVNKAFNDPQVAKLLGDRDFFVTRLFGKA